MPREFNLIQRGDLQQRLARGLDLVGESSPARTLDPTVQAVVLLEDLTRQNLAIEPVDTRLGGSATAAAVAAEFPIVGLVNPAQPGGNLILVEALSFVSTSTMRIRWGFGSISSLAPTSNNISYYDWRAGVPPLKGAGIIWAGTDPASVMDIALGFSSAGTSTHPGDIITTGLVLVPGAALIVEGLTVNLELSVGFRWTEYALIP